MSCRTYWNTDLVLAPMIWKKNQSSQGVPHTNHVRISGGRGALSCQNYWKFSLVFSHVAKFENDFGEFILGHSWPWQSFSHITFLTAHSLIFTPMTLSRFHWEGVGMIFSSILIVPLLLWEMNGGRKHHWEFVQKWINSGK